MIFALNKPYGILSQFTPEPGSVWQTLATLGLPKNIYPIGRLDADSEGLLLLTDEPSLNTRLLDPTQKHPREYLAQIERIPAPESLQKLAAGTTISRDQKTLPCKITLLATEPNLPPRNPPIRHRKTVPTAWLSLELNEGKNRQVRRMTASIDHPTLRLIRIRIGRLTLASLQLQPGSHRPLSPQERQLLLQ